MGGEQGEGLTGVMESWGQDILTEAIKKCLKIRSYGANIQA